MVKNGPPEDEKHQDPGNIQFEERDHQQSPGQLVVSVAQGEQETDDRKGDKNNRTAASQRDEPVDPQHRKDQYDWQEGTRRFPASQPKRQECQGDQRDFQTGHPQTAGEGIVRDQGEGKIEELNGEGDAQPEWVLAFDGHAPIIDHLGALGCGLAVGIIAILEKGARRQPGDKEILLAGMYTGIERIAPHQTTEDGDGEEEQEDGGYDGGSAGHGIYRQETGGRSALEEFYLTMTAEATGAI